MNATARITHNRFPELEAKVPGLVGRIVAKTAHDVQAEAQDLSRLDIGTMKAGWTAEQEAETVWVVYNGGAHVIFNEYGTVHMSAQPMLAPAVDHAKPRLAAAVNAALQSL